MKSDFKNAVRSLVRRPGYTGVIVLTLAVIIGCNTAIFTMLNAVLLRPLAYASPERLVTLWESNRGQGIDQADVSAPVFVDWRQRAHSLDSVTAYRYLGHTLTVDGGDPVHIASVEVSPSLFKTVGVQAGLGRAFTADEEKLQSARVALLSHSAWVTRFGADPKIVGRVIRLDGQPVTIVGVMPREFQFPPADSRVEVWIPLRLGEAFQQPRMHRMYNVVARLAPEVAVKQAKDEMNRIGAAIASEHPDSNAGWGVTLVPAHDQLIGKFRTMLWMLFGAVTLVLLIGCVNVANLVLARAAESTREFAVRSALGAKGFALLRFSLAEGLLLSFAGGLAGLAIAQWGVVILRGLVPAGIPRADQIRIDVAALLFTAVVSALAGLVFGAVPVLQTMRSNLSEILQGSGRGSSVGRGMRRLSDLLVAAEVALAVILLIGAGLMVGSLLRLVNTDPGFRKSNVISAVVSLPQARYPEGASQRQFFNDLVARVKAIPGVESAGAVSRLPMSSVGTDFNLPFNTPGLSAASPSERPRVRARVVIAGYFQAMGIRLLRGRVLQEMDGENGYNAAVINETMAKLYFKDKDPIGRKVGMPMMGEVQIVGIAGDVLHDGLQASAGPEIYVPFKLFPVAEMHIVAHTLGDAGSTINTIKQKILEIDPQQPITETSSIEQLLSASIAQPRFNMAMLIALGVCAVVLAAVGIYGVVSYAVARRTTEIGVRMALGAGRGQTLRLIVGEAVRVVGVGAIVGVLCALGLVRFIRTLLFEIQPTNLPTYATSIVVVLAIGVLAAAVPAIRATRVDPVECLRQS